MTIDNRGGVSRIPEFLRKQRQDAQNEGDKPHRHA